jgi:hypothetical protein
MIGQGMPVESNGLVNRERAIRWIKTNVHPIWGGWLMRKNLAEIAPLQAEYAAWVDEEFSRIFEAD